MFVEISFPISSFKLFTYQVPKELQAGIKKGMAVNAKFRNRTQSGFIISIMSESDFKGEIQPIIDYNEQGKINQELWITLKWMSQYYLAPIGKTIKLAYPFNMNQNHKPSKKTYVKINKRGISAIKTLKSLSKNKLKLLITLNQYDDYVALSDIQKKEQINPYAIYKNLLKDKLIHIKSCHNSQNSLVYSVNKKISKLSKKQDQVLKKITLNQKQNNSYLLHGITGSGKTEIYIHLCFQIFNAGKSTIILVPEIILTNQMVEKFKSIFYDNVITWHSKISTKQKKTYFQQITGNKQCIIIGTRSALFLPLKNLGLLIVDEEHDVSYKQEGQSPHYNARDVALVRARHAGATIVLGSATPSIESYYNTTTNKLSLLELKERYGQSVEPEIKVVDMQTQKYSATGKQKVLSQYLIDHIFKVLDKKEQAILLYNRRGFSLSMQCTICNEYIYCPKCNITLTYHKHRNQLLCHYCNNVETIAATCMHCESNKLQYSGLGIQHIEEILNKIFTDYRVLRIDSDVKSIKDTSQKLKNFESQKYHILLGTQMITKGHDFSNVTLVGIINADHGLYLPDFRSGENVFQMISQVIGRSGRRNKKAMAIIQTNNYKDQYIQYAKLNKFDKYYQLEANNRKALNYPPFSRLIRIIFSGIHQKNTLSISKEIANKIKLEHTYEVFGPFSAIIEKINKQWRYHILIKAKKTGENKFQKLFINQFGLSFIERPYKGIKIKIDIDPFSMF